MVSGDEIDPAVTAEVDGKMYAFCCPDCVDKFKAEPAKYLAASSAASTNGDPATPAAAETQAVLFGKGTAHSLKIPKAWKTEPPANNMRLSQASAPKHPDDEEDAEFTVTKASGGVEANLARWAKTLFNDEQSLSNRRTLKTASEKEATLADYEGTYTAMSFGPKKAEPKKNFKMLGAIVVAEDGEYFIRLTGPKQTVEKWKSAFEPLVLSFQ